MQYLVVSRVGSKSLHRKWLNKTEQRRFDIFLSAYDSSLPSIEGEGIFFEYRPGYKVLGYAEFLKENSHIWKNYDYVMLMDEDIEVDGATLNAIFETCSKEKLKISQPALTHDSYFTYAATLQQKSLALRYVNFIEMMCPVFRVDVLDRIEPLYSMGYESGIDLVWCNIVSESDYDFAIMDATPVRHTQPIGGEKASNGFIGDKTYEDDIYRILKRFDLPWLSCTPFAARTSSGRLVRSRPILFLSALTLVPALFHKSEFSSRLRSLAVHLRHLISGRPVNMPRTL